MKMKLVRFAGRQLGADKHEIRVLDHARLAMPVVRFAGKCLDLSLVE